MEQIVAVLSWTDSKQKVTPLKLKYQAASQEIITVNDIEIKNRNILPGASARTMEFLCEAPNGERRIRFRLRYYPLENKWVMFTD